MQAVPRVARALGANPEDAHALAVLEYLTGTGRCRSPIVQQAVALEERWICLRNLSGLILRAPLEDWSTSPL